MTFKLSEWPTPDGWSSIQFVGLSRSHRDRAYSPLSKHQHMDDCSKQLCAVNGCEGVAEASQSTSSSSCSTHLGVQQSTGKPRQNAHPDCDNSSDFEHAVLQQLERLQLAATAAESQQAPASSSLVTLNVGGKLFTCQRQTLCLVEESLLGMMFSGRWPEHDARDADGNMFLDLDPELFEVVINWLRRFNISRAGNIPEPVVPEDKVVHMVVMLDYLLLHRHIPITYQGAFDHQYYSPYMMVHGATATRTGVTAQHKGRHKTQALKNNLMQFAVTDTAHSFFDMLVDVTVEVTSFLDTAEASRKPALMFIGFMSKAAAAELDPAGDINTQLTKSPSCYGWLVSSNGSHTVRNGARSEQSCTKDSPLWSQGDQLVLSLNTRRDRPCANISILNTRTGEHKTLDAEPVVGSSSSSQPCTDQDKAGSSSSSNGGNSKPSRLGRRHRRPKNPILSAVGGLGRQEILAILDRQDGDVNNHLAELVVAAAMQVLEAQEIQLQAALNILRQPGLIQRLVQQVRHMQRIVRDHAGGTGDRQQRQQQQQPAANGITSAGAADGSAAANDAGQSDAESSSAAAATSNSQRQQQVAHLQLRNGELLPQSSSDYDWVLVVGLVRPGDSVKLLSVRRRGQRPDGGDGS